MPLRNLLFVFAAGLGWFARGATIGPSHVAAAPTVAHPIEVRYPTIAIAAAVSDSQPTADPASDDSDAPEDDSTGDDIGELLAKAKLATTNHNGVHGHVADHDTGAPLRNVLVLVTRADDHERTSTNADGDYELDDLDAGTYTVNFVYGSVYTTHENISVSSFDLSTVDERIDSSAAEREPYDGEEVEWESSDREDEAPRISEETGERVEE